MRKGKGGSYGKRKAGKERKPARALRRTAALLFPALLLGSCSPLPAPAEEVFRVSVPGERALPCPECGETMRDGVCLRHETPVLEPAKAVQSPVSGSVLAYEIGNAGQLYWFVQAFYEGALESENVRLSADIDCTVLNDCGNDLFQYWTPLGRYGMDVQEESYNGHFDGDGHCIRNLRLQSPTDGYEAAFCGSIGEYGILEKLVIESMQGELYQPDAAALAIVNRGIIRDCMVTGTSLKVTSPGAAVSEAAALNYGRVENVFCAVAFDFQEGEGWIQNATAPVCGLDLSGGSGLRNCYYEPSGNYLNPAAPEVFPADQALQASGELSWRLNLDREPAVFAQNLGTQVLPAIQSRSAGSETDENRVYRVVLDYEGSKRECCYRNNPLLQTELPADASWNIITESGHFSGLPESYRMTEDLILIEIPGEGLTNTLRVEEEPAGCETEGRYRILCGDCGDFLGYVRAAPTGHRFQNGICAVCGMEEPAGERESEAYTETEAEAAGKLESEAPAETKMETAGEHDSAETAEMKPEAVGEHGGEAYTEMKPEAAGEYESEAPAGMKAEVFGEGGTKTRQERETTAPQEPETGTLPVFSSDEGVFVFGKDTNLFHAAFSPEEEEYPASAGRDYRGEEAESTALPDLFTAGTGNGTAGGGSLTGAADNAGGSGPFVPMEYPAGLLLAAAGGLGLLFSRSRRMRHRA